MPLLPHSVVHGASSRGSRGEPGGCSLRAIAALFLSLLALSTTTEGSAQAVAREVVIENDALTGIFPGRSHTDREYTHGMGYAIERSDAPFWGRLFPRYPTCGRAGAEVERCLSTRLELGQKIFTPNYQDPEPDTEGRPYAGWLFAGMTSRFVSPGALRSLQLTVGVTGKPSLAELVQRSIHRVTNFPDPEGWSDQLGFEPGLIVRYAEERVIEMHSPSGDRMADVVLSSDASLGNVRTGVGGAVTARVGYRIPHPWQLVGAHRGFALHAFGKLRRQYVVRDLFLDGNSFRESESVVRIPFTGAQEVGVGLHLRNVQVTYRVVFEDRLYETQPKPHFYHAIGVSVLP